MQSEEHDHPLRADPLQHLPDAVVVPRRRPHRTSTSNTPTLTPPTTNPPSPPHLSPLLGNANSTFATSSFDRRTLAKEALHRFSDNLPNDPLLSAVVEHAHPPPTPPAGHAFATDIGAIFSSSDDAMSDDAPPVAAGIVHRSDVTLLPTDAETGAAAGVFIVRSRRNWGLLVESSSYTTIPTSPSSLTHPRAPSPHSPSHDHHHQNQHHNHHHNHHDDYYRVRRSLADFTWLHHRLIARYDGIIVPSLPPLSFAGRVAHGFAHDVQRRRGLQRFLRRVAMHAVLSTGDEVLTFLGASGEDVWRKLRREPIVKDSSVTDMLFGAARGDDAQQQQQQQSHGGNGALHRVAMWGERLLWQTGKRFNQGLVWFLERDRASEQHRDAEDSAKARFERLQTYIRELSVTLSALRCATARVAKTRAQGSAGMHELQTALQALAHREGGKFGAHLKCFVFSPVITDGGGAPVATTNANANRQQSGDRHFADVYDGGVDAIRGRGSGAAAWFLEEVISDYEERTKGALRIMAARQEEQEAYERALATYKKLRDRLESQADSMCDASEHGVAAETDGNESARGEAEDDGYDLVRQVNLASDRLSTVRKHYQVIAIRTTDELRRLRKEMHADLCEALECLAKELVREHMEQVQAWTRVAELVGEYRGLEH